MANTFNSENVNPFLLIFVANCVFITKNIYIYINWFF